MTALNLDAGAMMKGAHPGLAGRAAGSVSRMCILAPGILNEKQG
jgi:hypothetical protein